MSYLEQIADSIAELVDPRTHREALAPDQAPISVRTGKHLHGAVVTHVASLVDQLDHIQPGGGIEEGGHRVPGSRPTAHLEALDALMLIDAESSQWLALLDLADRHGVVANLRALVGAATVLAEPDQRDLAANAKRWVTIAAVITGWQIPAWRPDNTCPMCAARGSLRVRAGNGVSTTEVSATCVKCWTHWDATNVGLLASHIRAENDELVICERHVNDIIHAGSCTIVARSA